MILNNESYYSSLSALGQFMSADVSHYVLYTWKYSALLFCLRGQNKRLASAKTSIWISCMSKLKLASLTYLEIAPSSDAQFIEKMARDIGHWILADYSGSMVRQKAHWYNLTNSPPSDLSGATLIWYSLTYQLCFLLSPKIMNAILQLWGDWYN